MSIFPTKVLLATDGSREAQLAARTAIDLANKDESSELHVIYVEPGTFAYQLASWESYLQDLPDRLDKAAEEVAKTRLNELVPRIREENGEVAGAHARVGDPATHIVRVAEEIGAGVIVMGSRGLGGVRRALMGSVSDSVVRHAHCAVMIVRE